MSDAERLWRNRAGCLRGLGLFFVAGGVLVTTMLAGGSASSLDTRSSVFAAVLAAAHVAAGVVLIVIHPGTTVQLDASGRRLVIVRRWFFLRRTRELHVDEVRHAVIREEPDSDGHPTYRLELALTTGEALPIPPVPLPVREPLDAWARRLAEWSGHRIPVRHRRGAQLPTERG